MDRNPHIGSNATLNVLLQIGVELLSLPTILPRRFSPPWGIAHKLKIQTEKLNGGRVFNISIFAEENRLNRVDRQAAKIEILKTRPLK